MISLEEIKARAEAAVPAASITIVANPSPANQPSLLLDNEHAAAVVGSCAMILLCDSTIAQMSPASIGWIAR